MPSLKDIRRRIGSVKNTQKITRAMKLVSAAKFARANTAVVSARPYGKAFDSMVSRLVSAAGDRVESPMMSLREEKKALLVVLSTDRGFCGSLNTNLFKAASAFLAEKAREGVKVELMAWGKRSRLYAAKQAGKAQSSREKVLEKPGYHLARELAEEISARFEDKTYDRVYIAFVEFRSALSQSPKVLQLLPIGVEPVAAGQADASADRNLIVEPGIGLMLEGLLRRALASRIFRCMLEGAASEHGARMTAMDSATNNASEVIRKLNIQYNRARQAAITKELIEIISGAQAL